MHSNSGVVCMHLLLSGVGYMFLATLLEVGIRDALLDCLIEIPTRSQ